MLLNSSENAAYFFALEFIKLYIYWNKIIYSVMYKGRNGEKAL